MHTSDPEQYARWLAARLAECLGDALVAAYLHGSAALGGWKAERSDVDVLLLAADDIGASTISATGDLLISSAASCPGRGLECSMVTAGQAAQPGSPWPFVLHLGSAAYHAGEPCLYLGAGRPGDPDLLMHYAVCREAGMSLAGPPPREVIGPVDRLAILDYLADELCWGLDHAPECYAVLNACRALVFLADGQIVSKVAGGIAALERGLGPPRLLRGALDQQQGKTHERPPGRAASSFVHRARHQLAAAAVREGQQRSRSDGR